MHSIVQTADLLRINYRTLWKLDLKHLDATLRLETEGEDGTAAWAYHVQMLAGDTGIDFTCTST